MIVTGEVLLVSAVRSEPGGGSGSLLDRGEGPLLVRGNDDALLVPGSWAEVALARGGRRVADKHEGTHRSGVHFAMLSADTWSRSARACRSTSVKVPGSCAPETPYLPSITKNGTPWMPYAAA